MAWLPGWKKRIELAINDYAGDIGGEITWFPATIHLKDANGGSTKVFLEVGANYRKIAITKADGETELKGEIAVWNYDSGTPANSTAIIHTSADGWVIDSNTKVYLYYDKDHADNDNINVVATAAGYAVYDGNHKGVWHMADYTFAKWSAGFDAWNVKYEANVEPDSDGWTQLYDDYASVSAGILTIDTSADDANRCLYYQTPDVNFDNGFYLKTRVKASTNMNPLDDQLSFHILDGTQDEMVLFDIRNGSITSNDSIGNMNSVAMDTTTNYVVYEIYIKAIGAGLTYYWLYADGVLKATNLRYYSFGITDRVSFGDLAPDKMCKAQIDYVYYALNVGVGYDHALAGKILDSTSNVNHGTKKGTGEPLEVAGKVGQAQSFDGINDYITMGDIFDFGAADDFTISCCFKTAGANAYLISKVPSDAAIYWYTGVFADVLRLKIKDVNTNTVQIVGETTVSDNVWRHGTFVRDAGAKLYVYLNGASNAVAVTDTTDSSLGSAASVNMGAAKERTGSENWFTGPVDEVQISNVIRSDAWIKATYNSLWDALFTYGDEETEGILTGYFMTDGEKEELFDYLLNLVVTAGYYMNPL